MSGLIYADKTIDELSLAELKACALHFRDAHVEAVHRMAAMLRRMSKLEEGYSREALARLDTWLKYHAVDDERYANWRSPEWIATYERIARRKAL